MSQACCVTGRGEGIGANRVSLLAPPWHDTNPARERGQGERCNGPDVEVRVYLLKSNVCTHLMKLRISILQDFYFYSSMIQREILF